MEQVEEVRPLDDRRLHWPAALAGKDEEWGAEITKQMPDERIAGTSTTGAKNAAVVTFHSSDPNTTRVMPQLEYEPEGAVEAAGSALGILQRQIEGDMRCFKAFIEARGRETGEWRGEIGHNPAAGGRTDSCAGDTRRAIEPRRKRRGRRRVSPRAFARALPSPRLRAAIGGSCAQ